MLIKFISIRVYDRTFWGHHPNEWREIAVLLNAGGKESTYPSIRTPFQVFRVSPCHCRDCNPKIFLVVVNHREVRPYLIGMVMPENDSFLGSVRCLFRRIIRSENIPMTEIEMPDLVKATFLNGERNSYYT